MLDKITPHKPFACNKKYYCWYCGVPLRKGIGIKKHKCGYLIDWDKIVDEER